jgi:hypothetical protein
VPQQKNSQGVGQRSALFRAVEAVQADVDAIRREADRNPQRDQVINRQAKVITRQAHQIEALSRGLRALTSALGPQAEQLVVTAMTRRADVQNPAQPIPEPPAQPAAFTTEDAKTPEAMESPQNPGLTPGSTNDVAADATTTVYQPGADVENQALHNLIDVTTPVDGTQGPRPLSETRTQTDIRVGDPNNQSQAFPLRGDFAQQRRLSSHQASAQPQDASRRTMAALRLVEARAATGDPEAEGNKFALAAAIEKDASRSTEMIEQEIGTLEKVAQRTTASKPAPRGLVPRQAAAQPRAVPQMSSEASFGGVPVEASDIDDSDLFL